MNLTKLKILPTVIGFGRNFHRENRTTSENEHKNNCKLLFQNSD